MHFLSCTRKRWIAAISVTLVAFAHTAIAVSGCLPGTMPASAEGCERHQKKVPDELLCRTHLQAETQTLDLAKVKSIVPLYAPALVVAPTRVVRAEIGVRLPARAPVGGAPPPLNVLYSRYLT